MLESYADTAGKVNYKHDKPSYIRDNFATFNEFIDFEIFCLPRLCPTKICYFKFPENCHQNVKAL